MDDPRDPPLRELPPGLFYTKHTVVGREDLVETSPMTQSKVRRVRGVLSDDFNDLSLMYEFFDAAEKHSKPTTAPSLILTCANIECKETQINRQGFQVHTLVLPAATLSLPEPITQLPGFTRVHAILQLVTDCDEGDLLTIDSVSRVEDGVRRMQT